MNKYFHYFLFFIIISISSSYKVTCKEKPGNKPKFLNLNFEVVSPNGKPKKWRVTGNGYKITIDNNVTYSGKNSIRIKRISKFNVYTGSIRNTFPVNAARGKHITYSGFIKTKNITYGNAGLFLSVVGENEQILNFDKMKNRGVKGTTGWKKYKIEMDVSKKAKKIYFGALLAGDGTAWFDNLNIKINGKEYKQIYTKPFVPTEKQLAWVRKNAIPFKLSTQNNKITKLKKLKQIIGNTKIIALGEDTHGTSEFFKMKEMIVKYMANKYKNLVFAMEINMPVGKDINKYTETGEGNIKPLLQKIDYGIYNTHEMFSLIKWMRKYNLSKKGKIKFGGFDIANPYFAIKNVKKFINKYDVNYSDSALINYRDIIENYKSIDMLIGRDRMREAKRWLLAANKVYNHLTKYHNKYLTLVDSSKVDWVIQNSRIVCQNAEMYIPEKDSRNKSMASNIEWIINRSSKKEKIIIWAHNYDVSKDSDRMGNYLYKKYGNKYINFALAFYSGKYLAAGDSGITVFKAANAQPGSIEYALHETGIKRMILDLRKASSQNVNSTWLNQTLDFRRIGIHKDYFEFYPESITKNFDVLIFFDKTVPTHLIKSYSISKLMK